MTSSWQMEKGHLVCRWFEAGKRVPYKPAWIEHTADTEGSYLPPSPDFASHSPFGGAAGFWCLPQSHYSDRD